MDDIFVVLDPRSRSFMRAFKNDVDAIQFFKSVFSGVPDYVIDDCIVKRHVF